jgi:hypothetical protein
MVVLTCASDKVEIFATETHGTKLKLDGSDNSFRIQDLPKDLWIQGVKPSDTMRDIEVDLAIEGQARSDFIKFTVLWVDTPVVKLSDSVTATDNNLQNYQSWTVDNNSKLMLQRYNDKFGERMGWGSEASGAVHPKAFSYPTNNLKLEREVEFHDWKGNGTSTIDQDPWHDDTTTSHRLRDDDPAPDDTIYDLDAPGLDVPVAPFGEVRRTRNNFKAYATITVQGRRVRCSPVAHYFVRFSMKQTKKPQGDRWKPIDPPDVSGDDVATDGSTSLTWNLTIDG